MKTDLDNVFSKSLSKVAQPIQLTQPVMETPAKSGTEAKEGFLSKPINVKTPEDALPDQKKMLGDSFDSLQRRILALRRLLSIVNSGRPDMNTQNAVAINEDCLNIITSIKKDLKDLAVI